MKREMHCENCGKKLGKLFAKEQYPGESVIMWKGTLRHDIVCDYGGELVKKDEIGISSTILGRGNKYTPWEGSYLNEEGGELFLLINGGHFNDK